MGVKRILIVRTSSMGDLIHTLPAVSDIASHFPGVAVDWVAEEGFAEIPSWHPAVDRVIPVAMRRWRKAWFSPQVRQERAAYIRLLQEHSYDAVIDSQGLLKSAALVALRARGPRHGLDWHSAREPAASLFYGHRHRVEPMQPAVLRYRSLAGLALGYAPEGPPDFALDVLQGTPDPVTLDDGTSWPGPHGAGSYAAIMPSASRDTKLWPESHWQAVLRRLDARGCTPLVFAGNAEERARAARIIDGVASARILPRMALVQTARVVAGARIMVGLDSGITHLAAALVLPTVGIYCATPVVRTPLTGAGYCASLGDRGRPPSLEEVERSVDEALHGPAAAGQTSDHFAPAVGG